MGNLYMGIDPGVTGGCAIVADGDLRDSLPFAGWRGFSFVDGVALVGLEKVHAFPGQGVSSVFNFGANYGGWLSLLEFKEIPHVLVPPQRWQKALLGVFPRGESKARALEYVNRRFGTSFKKKHSGEVDAICIALYTQMVHEGVVTL